MGEIYIIEVPAFPITLEMNYLHRTHEELHGELSVRCSLPGAKTVNGYLITGSFNLSSIPAREKMAKTLADRSQTNGQVDWLGHLEALCQDCIKGEREGAPAIDLRTIPCPPKDDHFNIDGLVFPRRQPTIIFGDGGSAKSLMALYIAGALWIRGIKVGYFDWEMSGEDHRERLERLYGPKMPEIFYCECERPLHFEADRLHRIVKDNKIDYAIYDSIAFACDGPPEAAEVTARYFRALRIIGTGSLHIAHVNKSENHDQKPFGSSFWHNGARSTWYVQAVTEDREEGILPLAFHNRKFNLGQLAKPVGFEITFCDENFRSKTDISILVQKSAITNSPQLVKKLTVKERMYDLLTHGAMTPPDIASELDLNVDDIYQAFKRGKGKSFVKLSDGRYAVLGRA